MIEKKNILISLLCLFFLTIILTPINAQQETTRGVDVDLARQGPEFIIHWRYSDFPDNTRADTIVSFVENSAKDAWQKIILQWNFNEPPDKDGIIDIYINDGIHEWGVFNKKGTLWAANTTADVIYIQHTIQEYFKNLSIEWTSEQDVFDIAIAHEFFHAVQHNYSITSTVADEIKGQWIIEGSARFIESVVNPSATFYSGQNANKKSLYISDAVDYLRAPDKGLSIGRLDSEAYDVGIFWRYIFEQYGGINTIEKIFEKIRDENPINFISEIDSISNGLQGPSTQDAFSSFAKVNYLEFSNNRFTRQYRENTPGYYNPDAYYENVPIVDNKVFEYSEGNLHLASNKFVDSFAANYIEFEATQSDPVYVVFSGAFNTEWRTSLVLYTSSKVEVVDFDRAILVVDPNHYEKIGVVVANVGFNAEFTNVPNPDVKPSSYNLMLRSKPAVVDVILDTDRSGSMGGTPMSSAKNAAKAFIDLLQKPIDNISMDKVGLVSFASSATLDLGLTTDFVLAKQKIDVYYASGSTNMGDALRISINQIRDNGRLDSIKSIIFLTDGYTNVGPSKSQILNTIIPEAINLGIKVYTLGFGGADTSFLQEIASKTNGKYFYSPSPSKLKEIYEELSQSLIGWSKVWWAPGVITTWGETKVVGGFDTHKGIGSIKVILYWPGSNLDLILVDPDGNVVQPGDKGVFHSGDTNPEYYEIFDPKPGNWTVQVYGKEVVNPVPFDVSVYQPVPLMDVKPTKWDINYLVNNSQVFTVSELGGYSSLLDVTFAASDLKMFDVAAEQAQMAELAEAELAGESLEFSELEQGNVTIIPGSSFSFTPNNFEVTAGSSESVLAVLTVPPSIPNGNYSGSITVSSNAGNSTVIVTLDYVRPKTSPYDLKSEALGKLRNMSVDGDCYGWFWWLDKECRNEHRINNAVYYLEQSLNPDYWGDVYTLNSSLGGEVFDYEKDVVGELMALEE